MAQQATGSWYSPTYQVYNSANVALLPHHAEQASSPLIHRPFISQSYSSDTRPVFCANSQLEEYSHGQRPVIEHDFPIKVINPDRKRDAKTFILRGVQPPTIGTLVTLRQCIFEQLGKDVVSFQLKFDVGYMNGNKRICFRERDEIKLQLENLAKANGQLWCEGLSTPCHKRSTGSKSDSDDESTDLPPSKKHCPPKRNAFDEKADRVQKLADELQTIHKDVYNKIQYKLWAEALDVKKHTSMEKPPPGTIWGETRKGSKSSQSVSDAMSTAFTKMATSLASVLGKSSTPPSSPGLRSPAKTSNVEVVLSPGKLADLQGKFFTQLEQLHRLLECGALDEKQFEKRKQVILERLDELAEK